MSEPVPGALDLQNAQDVTPPEAPVGVPLSEKERAGVNLTWGVLGVIGGWLVFVLIFLWTQEAALRGALPQSPQPAGIDTVGFRLVASERAAFRAFWLDMVQMVLVNVLLPVLTALLGYVFGTQARRSGES